MEVNKVYHMDCLEGMKGIADKSIDMIVTSPPYFLKKEYEKNTTYQGHCHLIQTVLHQANRVLKGGGYAIVNFGDYFNSGNRFYAADIPSCYPATIDYFNWGVLGAGMDLQATRIWRKKFAKMGIPFVCNTHPRPIFDYEHVWTFRKRNGSNVEFVNDRKLSQRAVIGEDWTSKADIPTHCAAFPIELPTWAINVYSKTENDIILDPFMGSGTTAIAAINTGRNYIGFEKEEKYYHIIQERIKKHNPQLQLIA